METHKKKSWLNFSDHTYEAATPSTRNSAEEKEKLCSTLKKERKKTWRLKKKVKTLQEALDECKHDLSPESYVELSDQCANIPQSLLKEHDRKVKEKTKCKKYDDAIVKFALSLHLKSSSAYNYVRKSFSYALPCERTIRKWCEKIDSSPGFSKPALDHLKNKAAEFEAENGRLLVSLTFDEMSIKKYCRRKS